MLRTLNPYFRAFIINKRKFHTNNCLFIYEKKKSGYPIIYDEPPITKDKSFIEKLKIAIDLFKEDFKIFVEEVRKSFRLPMDIKDFEEIILKFDGTERSLKQWIVNYDSVYNEGFSTAKLELSSFGTGIFHGIINTTVPKDGRIRRAGYCNITTIPKFKPFLKTSVYYDWSCFNQLVLRVRGDGRCYIINILQKGYFDLTWNNMYSYVMYTRGGPYWQVMKIPFAKFVFLDKGVVQDHQYEMPLTSISNLGITLADKKPGPFRLEIDYIAVSYDPYNIESCAYELYDVTKF